MKLSEDGKWVIDKKLVGMGNKNLFQIDVNKSKSYLLFYFSVLYMIVITYKFSKIRAIKIQ